MSAANDVRIKMEMRSVAGAVQRQSPIFVPWAILGAAWCALVLYMVTSWVTGPNFVYVQSPTGPDVPPGWMVILAKSLEVVRSACSRLVIYKFVIKPWHQSGAIGADGLLSLACMTVFWQDLLCNYLGPFAQYNSLFVSWGSWANYYPGWQSPNMGQLPEAVLGFGLSYGSWFMLLPMIYGGKFVTWLRGKYPNMSTLEIFVVSVLVFTAIWFPIEDLALRTCMWGYGLAISSATLWAGEYYQHPIYEFVLWGVCLGVYGVTYSYRDDKGYMWMERGIERLQASTRTKKALRFFAMAGFVNAVFMGLWSVPMTVSTIWADPMVKWPSYMMNGLCGPGTNYDCPGPGVPIARRSTLTNRTNVRPDQLPVSPAQQTINNRYEFH